MQHDLCDIKQKRNKKAMHLIRRTEVLALVPGNYDVVSKWGQQR